MNNENTLQLEFPEVQKSTGPVTCLDMTFENDEEWRKYFLDNLREKLQYPEFRKRGGLSERMRISWYCQTLGDDTTCRVWLPGSDVKR